jgi:quercetin dioxygenase-like cupin family protein
MTTATLKKTTPNTVIQVKYLLAFFFLLVYLSGLYVVWQWDVGIFVKIASSFLGLPLVLLLCVYLALIGFARSLPDLDLTVGNRMDRTVRNNEGNYEATFLETGRDTGGAYELIQVEIEPNGGNSWHYHKSFDEYFTVLNGELTVGLSGKTHVLKAGEGATAPRKSMHYFHNATNATVTILVKATPAKGLEKSVRIGYGLHNTGQWGKGFLPKNPWHLPLLLAYSETYLPNLPGFIQEPLINSLAKIAQWKGEDKALEEFFK